MDFRLLDTFLIFICQQQQASKRCFFECDRDVLGWLLLKSDTAIQRYSDTGTGTWNRNLEPCIIYGN